jgi:cytochrome b561
MTLAAPSVLMAQRYTSVAIALHWLIAAAILCTALLGLYMRELPLSPDKLRLYSYHKWIGVTIFLLVLIRLAWRLTHRPPAPPRGMPLWQQRAAHGAHVLLYVLTLIIPLSGWLMSSASGFQVVYLGILPIPDLLAKNKEVAEQLKTVHETLNLLMFLLVAMHIGAALKHHLVDRDDILARMLPALKPRSTLK